MFTLACRPYMRGMHAGAPEKAFASPSGWWKIAVMEISDDLATLQELNRNYVRAGAEPDLRWYADNLAEDYRATNPDGSFVDKAGFLARFKEGGRKKDYEPVDVNIRILGDVALIHSGFLDRGPDGTVGK